MSLWSWLFGDASETSRTDSIESMEINPATGLPMIGSGMGGLDVGGSPFGMDLHQSDTDWSAGAGDISGGTSTDWSS